MPSRNDRARRVEGIRQHRRRIRPPLQAPAGSSAAWRRPWSSGRPAPGRACDSKPFRSNDRRQFRSSTWRPILTTRGPDWRRPTRGRSRRPSGLQSATELRRVGCVERNTWHTLTIAQSTCILRTPFRAGKIKPCGRLLATEIDRAALDHRALSRFSASSRSEISSSLRSAGQRRRRLHRSGGEPGRSLRLRLPQNSPTISCPLRVPSARQVFLSMFSLMARTEPSISAAWTIPSW